MASLVPVRRRASVAGSRRKPVALTTVVGLLAAMVLTGVTSGSPALAATDPCREPLLREVMISQGLPSYAQLVRNREVLVKFLLSEKSKTSCPNVEKETTQITSAAVTVSHAGGGGTGVLLRPVSGSTAVIGEYPTSPVPDSGADPVLQVPGSALLAPGETGPYTVTFTGTISYQTMKNDGTVLQSGTVPVDVKPGTTSTPITAVVAQPTRPLRLLLVPMYDSQNTVNPITGESDQFDETDEAVALNGLRAVGRIMPVADGVGELGSAAGVQYHLSEGAVNLGLHQELGDDNQLHDVTYLDANGKFCGGSESFDYITQELAEHRMLHNVENPLYPVDRVVGLVSERISRGPSTDDSSCAEGYASLTSPESWVRLAGPAPLLASPRGPRLSTAGGLFAQELQHTYGGSTLTSSFHSLSTTADATAPHRAYNTLGREYLTPERNRSASRFDLAPWDEYTVLYEKKDWDFTVCVLGSSSSTASQDCGSTAGATSSGVLAAGGSMILTGRTAKTAATTDAHTYFDDDVPRDGIDDASDVRLVQRHVDGSVLDNQGVRLRTVHSVHSDDDATSDDGRPVFDVALPATGQANSIELWRGAPDVAGSEMLYRRYLNAPPESQSIVRLPGASDAVRYTSDGKSSRPALSPDGQLVAWTEVQSSRTDVLVAPVTDVAKVAKVGETQSTSSPAWHPSGTKLALVRGESLQGDILVVDVAWQPGNAPVLQNKREVYADLLDVTGVPLAAAHPSYSPSGNAAVVVIQDDLWTLDLTNDSGDSAVTSVRCSLEQNVGEGTAGGCTRLTKTAEAERAPAWLNSPTEAVAYARVGPESDVGDPTLQLWAMSMGNLAGARAVLALDGQDVDEPAWAPSELVATAASGLVAVDATAVAALLGDSDAPALTNATPFTTAPQDTDASLSADGKRVAFVRDTADGHDVFLAEVHSRGLFLLAQDDNPEQLRLDVAIDCNDVNDGVVTGARPAVVIGDKAFFYVMYQAGESCPGADTITRLTDGYLVDRDVVPGDSAGDPPANLANIVVHSPAPGRVLLEFETLAVAGAATGADRKPRQDISWRLTGPGVDRPLGVGVAVDVLPPDGGWPAGEYQLTASLPDGAPPVAVPLVVTDDRDGDLIRDSLDDESLPGRGCFPVGAVNDPSNALADPDLDLLPTLFDEEPCQSHMNATVKTTPTTLYLDSEGTPVTSEVVTTAGLFVTPQPGDVRIVQIAGLATNIPAYQLSDITPTSLVAKFERSIVNAFVRENGLTGYVPLVVEAATSAVLVTGYDASSPTVK